MCVIDTLNVQINTLLLAFPFFLSLTRDRLSLCLFFAFFSSLPLFSFPHSLSPSAFTLTLPLSSLSPLASSVRLHSPSPDLLCSVSVSYLLPLSSYFFCPLFLFFFLSSLVFPLSLSLCLFCLCLMKKRPCLCLCPSCLSLSPSIPGSQRIIQHEGSHGVASNTQDLFVEFTARTRAAPRPLLSCRQWKVWHGALCARARKRERRKGKRETERMLEREGRGSEADRRKRKQEKREETL